MTVSVTEAARLLGISRSHAYELVRLGQLPAISGWAGVSLSRAGNSTNGCAV